METKDFTAPSYRQLRPLKPEKTKTFPVYDDLVNTLVAAQKHPDDEIAHVMGTCAGYAYSDGQTVAMIMARLGLEDNNCRMIAEYVDIMFITSTSFLIQSKDGRVVVLCYRGTPLTDPSMSSLRRSKSHLPAGPGSMTYMAATTAMCGRLATRSYGRWSGPWTDAQCSATAQRCRTH